VRPLPFTSWRYRLVAPAAAATVVTAAAATAMVALAAVAVVVPVMSTQGAVE
jgi:hypothetical protein